MAMLWLCPHDVVEYVELGRKIEAPTPACPLCSGPTGPWPGYERHLRGERDRLIWVARIRCRECAVTQAMLPWFVLPWRWDTIDAIGRALEMAADKVGVRKIAAAVGRPETTVREWVRRFHAVAETLAAAILALATSLGWSSWELPTARLPRCIAAVGALAGEWRRRYGTGRRWRITNLITGGRMLPSNIASLFGDLNGLVLDDLEVHRRGAEWPMTPPKSSPCGATT
jgi:hypothetical protein